MHNPLKTIVTSITGSFWYERARQRDEEKSFRSLTLQIIFDLCIPKKELAKTHFQI